MANFVLRRCRILQHHFVGDKEETVLKFDSFEGLLRHFVPRGERPQMHLFANLRRGEFIGFSKRRTDGGRTAFRFTDRTGDLSGVFANDPSLEGRILESYRIDDAIYDARFTEGALSRVA